MPSLPAITQEGNGDRVNNKLMSSFARLEGQRARMLHELDQWSYERLSLRPKTGAWSALEVVDHLVRTERLVRSTALETLPERIEVSTAERWKLYLLVCMFRLPVRVRVPTAVHMILPGALRPLRDLKVEWGVERQRLQELLRSPLAATADRAAIRHPAVGWINLHGALLFVSVHLKHHTFQMQRLKTSLPPPS